MDKESDERKQTKHTLGYMIAYFTMMYFDVWRIQNQQQPWADSMYYFEEKIWCMIREIDNIWRDNFKKTIQRMTLSDIFDSYYLTIWLWNVPTNNNNLEKFYDEYLEWKITKKEFLSFLKND